MSDPEKNTFATTSGLHWLVWTLREAGKVKRCHTVPCHHTPTVNEHGGNMVDLLLAVHPEPTLNLVRACRLHDTPERWSGDMPAPTKMLLGEHLRKFEGKCVGALGLGYTLNDSESNWLNMLDKLELLMWAWDERNMGNQNVVPMILDLGMWFGKEEAEGRMPEEIESLMEGFCWIRLTDYPPFDAGDSE